MGGDDHLEGRHIAVIGGGLIGAACAVRLAQAGARITLIDPGDERARASWGNASLIASELAEPLASWKTARTAPGRLFTFGGPLDVVWRDADLWLPWGVRYLAACGRDRFETGTRALTGLLQNAVPAWRRLLGDLGRMDLFQDTPHWSVWENPAGLRAAVAGLKGAATGAVVVREVASQELAAARREVSSRILGGVAFEGTAKVADPAEVVQTLHDRLRADGADLIVGAATAARLSHAGAEIDISGRTMTADQFLVAAGARSAPFVRCAGLSAPLIAERGYHLQYTDHRMAPGAPALIFEDRWIAVVQVGGAVRVSGFTELGRPDSPPDPRKWARLERHVRELGLPVVGEPSRWMGERPTLPDFLPAIGARGRLLYAFGHQHIGVTLAAVTAEAVAELARGGGAARYRPFALERFGRPSRVRDTG